MCYERRSYVSDDRKAKIETDRQKEAERQRAGTIDALLQGADEKARKLDSDPRPSKEPVSVK